MSKTRTVMAVAIATLAFTCLSAQALADAGSPRASCLGIEASNLSPPGSSGEVPGGMREFMQFVRENIPGTPGAFVSGFARLHEGSHEACDVAVGG